ncbi:hypothetical protein FGK63_06430 [Ruegeria sediminis]|uniref:Cadmium transporter n=1 Tax=Ruegeria sediminis TaxID=2583820 RepID=A0ABY2X0I9_9RHOB|nr:hypothetical protein [Ruegeria sediminis]TMV08753.1 hypothetical protein FGK63_06430 [Ruegeria sediminis]
MLDHLLFLFSAGTAQVLTNLDNMAALAVTMLVVGRAKAVGGFALAQLLVISASLAAAAEISGAIPSWTGYLGVIPLTLGAWGIWRQFARQPESMPAPTSKGSVFVIAAMFLGMSVDSFAVMAPLLADSTPSYRFAGFLGASLAAAGLAALAMLGAQASFLAGKWAGRLEKLGPFVMVFAGLYILSNSGTDAIQ